jgi:hypothetical protein
MRPEKPRDTSFRCFVLVVPKDHARLRRRERLRVERGGEDVAVLEDRPEAAIVTAHLVPVDRALGAEPPEGRIWRSGRLVLRLIEEIDGRAQSRRSHHII